MVADSDTRTLPSLIQIEIAVCDKPTCLAHLDCDDTHERLRKSHGHQHLITRQIAHDVAYLHTKEEEVEVEVRR